METKREILNVYRNHHAKSVRDVKWHKWTYSILKWRCFPSFFKPWKLKGFPVGSESLASMVPALCKWFYLRCSAAITPVKGIYTEKNLQAPKHYGMQSSDHMWDRVGCFYHQEIVGEPGRDIGSLWALPWQLVVYPTILFSCPGRAVYSSGSLWVNRH